MKKKVSKFFIVIIFLAGLSLLLYPFVANQWNNHRQKQLISSYEDSITQMTESGDIDYDKELKLSLIHIFLCGWCYCIG